MSTLPAARAKRLPKVRWLDARFVTGVVLVLVSVGVGARVVAQAARTFPVWAAARDLAAGTVLEADDLQLRQVRLAGGHDAYLGPPGAPPVGSVLRREVGAGELLPKAALTRGSAQADQAFVSVPVKPGHFPPGLRRGQRVDVYVTLPVSRLTADPAQPQPSAPSDARTARRVLTDVAVATVRQPAGGLGVTGGTVVILSVPRGADAGAVPPDAAADAGTALDADDAPLTARIGAVDPVAALIAAFQRGEVDLVAVGTAP